MKVSESSKNYEGRLTNGQYPRISLWENVCRGAQLPAKEPTSGSVLYEMAEAGALCLKNGASWMHNTSESHNGVAECSSSLSSILQPQQDVQTRYYLSAKACSGILRRAERRGKNLPERLRKALEAVVVQDSSDQTS
jgi:hypothetical protein